MTCPKCNKEFDEYVIETDFERVFVPLGDEDYEKEYRETEYKKCPHCNQVISERTYPI